MDPLVKGIIFLIALGMAVVSSPVPVIRGWRVFPLAFALFVVPFMWDAFDLAGDS
jgi:hypothetical protein